MRLWAVPAMVGEEISGAGRFNLFYLQLIPREITLCQPCKSQHPVGDGAVNYILFYFLPLPPSSAFPRLYAQRKSALNQTAASSNCVP
ncbi:hypothetical protein GOODEAATRI_000929 [Goodea atripinnis]|uniref:Uncharacterized protein n=1 Tax=Goodea atripinnis TaxID=208336 RepID=A0ABV0PJR0_9TELE